MKNTIHFSGLNGIRAIAALLVLFSHITAEYMTEFGLDPFVFGKNMHGQPRFGMGGFGVSIFFALSGFLITYLLLQEKENHSIAIKNFYIRRILRIWPLYYLYLGICLLTLYIFDFEFKEINSLFYVFMLANIPAAIQAGLPYLGHFWSLGIEEQFYLFWPWIVKKTSIKAILKTTLFLIAVLMILKLWFRYLESTGNDLPYKLIYEGRFHCLLFGAVGAILYYQKNQLFLKLTTHLFTQITSWLIFLLVFVNLYHITSFIDHEVVSICTVFIIMSQIEKKNILVNLENNFFNFIGKISYGIYVIHPLTIFFLSKIITPYLPGGYYSYFIVYCLSVLATISLAYLSYEFVEKRFLAIKDRYTVVKSSAIKTIQN